MKNLELKNAKRLALGVLTIVVLGAGALATKVSAQNAGVFEIQVPFDFVVKGRTFEAAKYRIGRLNQANPDVLVLKTAMGKTLMILQSRRGSEAPAGSSRLTFSFNGETHFLDSIKASGSNYESRVSPIGSDRQQGTEQLARIVAITAQ